jgi:hypothetical protein
MRGLSQDGLLTDHLTVEVTLILVCAVLLRWGYARRLAGQTRLRLAAFDAIITS